MSGEDNMTGIVKWFSPRKGYGFIVGEDDLDYFVHYSEILMEGFRKLKSQESVTFEKSMDENGRRIATMITLTQ